MKNANKISTTTQCTSVIPAIITLFMFTVLPMRTGPKIGGFVNSAGNKDMNILMNPFIKILKAKGTRITISKYRL